MMHKNSLEVYEQQIKPTIKNRHLKVMQALAVLKEACSLEVADFMNVPLNTVSGRFSELSGTKDYGRPMIEQVGTKKNRYGNTSAVWRIKVPQPVAKVQEMFKS